MSISMGLFLPKKITIIFYFIFNLKPRHIFILQSKKKLQISMEEAYQNKKPRPPPNDKNYICLVLIIEISYNP